MRRSFFRPAAHARRKAGVGLIAVAATTLVIAQASAAVAAPGTAVQASEGLGQRPLAAFQAAALSANATQHVIVFLKNEPAVRSSARPQLAARSAAIGASQSGLVRELSQVGATHVIGYRLVNAVAATVSAGEEARLRANPAVARIIPDAVIQGPPAAVAHASAAAATGAIRPLPAACLAHGKAQLEPEALQVTNTQSLAKGAKTARSLGFTGKGVTVAYIADGIDIHNVNFIKANGKSVFTEYKDFTGDGTLGASGGGGEAFLDANSIAAQGRHVYDVQEFSAQPLTVPCKIRIEGVAPDVSLEGLRVFGVNNTTTTSAFLDAINYATVVKPVNVLNESFGSNGIPDTSLDAVKQFDDAAVTAGITVVVSSGDAAPGTDTIGSPATDPNVISVGASTDFRAYAMSNSAEADKFARTGWLDNNISNISSSGFNATGAGIDLVAPGDSSFTSCSTDVRIYPQCTNNRGQSSGVQLTGGTSQSSPLTSGVAALVIQAYRKTHSGLTPKPAVVKQIIMSSASDLGAPGDEQGTGLLDAYKAVQLAESYGVPSAATGATLQTNVTSVSGMNASNALDHRQGQIDIQDNPGSPETASFNVTNTGSGPQTVHLSARTLGPVTHVQQRKVTLSNAHSGHFIDFAGFKDNYGEVHFTVPSGQQRLNAAMAFPAKINSSQATYPLTMILIDPQGRFAANSLPQGFDRSANEDVISPAAGTWTAVIFGPQGGQPLDGTTGTVRVAFSTQKLVPFGTLSQTTLTLAKGQMSAPVMLSVSTPSSPGDLAGSVVIDAGHGRSSIPVLLRSYVQLTGPGKQGGFRGNLIGGNGRGPGQFAFYQFNVASAGNQDITASVHLANDPHNLVNTYLVDPAGEIDGYGSNQYANSASGLSSQLTASSSAANVVPGTWTLVVEFVDPTGGNETSDPYTGSIAIQPGASVTGLPSGSIKDGTFTIHVKNTTGATQDIFLDPRLAGSNIYTLSALTSNTVQVPMKPTAPAPAWLVPAESSSLTVTTPRAAAHPFTFDLFPLLGDPDVASYQPGAASGSTTPSAVASPVNSQGPLTPGFWSAAPAPSAAAGFRQPDASHETVTLKATVATRPFDTSFNSGTEDLWYGSVHLATLNTFSPVIVPAGATASITITLSGIGMVSGTLYVDSAVPIQYPAQQVGGSELAAIPYSYTGS
jgi:Subtilase family